MVMKTIWYMMLPMGKSATPWRSALAHYFPKKVRLRQDSGSKGLKVNYWNWPYPENCVRSDELEEEIANGYLFFLPVKTLEVWLLGVRAVMT